MCGSVRALDPGVRRAARVAIPRHVLLPTGRVPKALRPSGVAPSGTRVASPGTVTANPATLVSPAVASATVATRLHGALLNITLACFSLGLAYGAGEVLVRIVAPQQVIVKRPDIWQPVDTLGWAHRPGVNTTINTGERTARLFTDRDGFRVGSLGRLEGKRRILLLGDSFMEALQVDYEQSLAGLLETRLAARLGETVAVRNTGVGGWDPPQYLMEARREVGREPLDLVLVSVYLGNDVVSRRIERYPPGPPVDAPFHQLRLPRRLTYGELVDAVFYPINDFLKARSHLFVLVKKEASTLRMRLGLTAEYFPDELLRREAASRVLSGPQGLQDRRSSGGPRSAGAPAHRRHARVRARRRRRASGVPARRAHRQPTVRNRRPPPQPGGARVARAVGGANGGGPAATLRPGRRLVAVQ